MRILQVSPAYYPAISIGGPIFSMLAFTRLALDCGHSVEVLSTPLGLLDEQKNGLTLGVWSKGPDGIHIMYHPYHGYDNFTFSPKSRNWLNENVKSYDLVVLHGVWNFPILAAAHACMNQGIPYILFPHGTLYKETMEMRSGWLKKLLFLLFAKKALKNATKIVYTTEDERAKVSKHLKISENSHILPNIVNSSEFSPPPSKGLFRKKHGLPLDAKIILHYGRITQKKGLNFTIQAMVRVLAKHPDARLVIAGGDEEGYKKAIDLMISDLGIQKHVLFTGLLSRADGLEALTDADVFVLPSLSENFGMAVVEAMLCRLPVVISEHVGIAPEIGRAGAGLVVPLEDNVDQLVGAILRTLDDPLAAHEQVLRAQRFAIDHYDGPAVKAQLSALLDSIFASLHNKKVIA